MYQKIIPSIYFNQITIAKQILTTIKTKNQKMKAKLLLLAILVHMGCLAQTIFTENMGTPSGTTSIAVNTFQNNSLTFSNGSQTSAADIRSTSASSSYSNASGGGNVYFTSTSGAYGFSIEGINASNYNTLSIQFGYKKEVVASHATFSVDYWNGSSWTTLANSPFTLFNEGSGAPAVWYLSKSLAIPADAQINGLKLRFVKTGSIAIRIDDVKLTGTENVPSVTNTLAASITKNSATFAGNVTATGGAAITATGTVYSVTATNANPVLGGSGVTTISTPSPNAGTGLFSNGSGAVLSPNVQYSYNAYATKSTGATGYGTAATFYTLAAIPAAPTVNSATGSSLNIAIGTDVNPSSTTYTVLETTSGSYVQANGTLGATAVYQTASVWGTKTVTGLSATTTYTFEAVAKNGAGTTTVSGPSANGTTLTPSNNSDIVFNGSSSTSTNSNLSYKLYQGTTLTNTGSGSGGSMGVMGFYLRDGGAGLNDADNLGTNLSAISFNITHWQNVKSARLFQGNSPKGTVVNVTGTTITFSGITDITAADNTQLALSLRVTFNNTVTDNDQMQFAIISVTADSSGSQFALANGGGASSALSGDINRIEVTASKLVFLQQPPTILYAGTVMSPAPVVAANDGLENVDLDFDGLVTLTSSGLLDTPQSAYAIAGVATIPFYIMDYFMDGTAYVLTASSAGLLSSNSDFFNVLASPEIILANLPPSSCNITTCNLVVNGDFEQVNSLPADISQLENACGWFNAYETPDYFHESSTSLITSIPCNFAGAQNCNNSVGSAYAGLAFFASNSIRSEIMVSRLSSPLIAGQNYQLSFDVSLAEGRSSFSKTVQAFLSPTTIAITPGIPIVIDNPQMLFTKTTTSTVSNGWETLTFNFTSTHGGEEFIYLGSFQDAQSQPNTTASDPSCVYSNALNAPSLAVAQVAYYYLDNVQIIPVEFETNYDAFIVNYAVSDLVTGTILTNDTYNGNDLSTVPTTLTFTVTPVGTPPTIPNGGISLNPDGTYTVLAGTTPGTYTFNYVITTDCGVSNTSAVTITVREYITSFKIEFQYCFNKNATTYTSTDSVTESSSLYDFVTILGVPASPSNATIQLVTPPIVPITINADGTFSIVSTVTTDVVPSGEYSFYYKVCANSTSFCSQDIRCDIYIHNSVSAIPDATTFYIDGSPTQSLNILANDFKWDCFDNYPATTGNVIITQLTPFDPSSYNINSSTGTIDINGTLNTGVYYLEYLICDADFPDNCSFAYIWIYQCITGDCPHLKTADAGNNEGILSNEFSISPNPSKANFTITFKEAVLRSGTFEVFDMLGKRLISQKIDRGVSNSFVNLENYPAGVYVLKIAIGNHTINRKLVKE